MAPPDDFEDLHPGTARERTELAWTRTAISFAAVGGAILKTSLAAGLVVLAMSVLIWNLRRLFPDAATAEARPRRLLLVAVAVAAVSLVALVVALAGHGGPVSIRSSGLRPAAVWRQSDNDVGRQLTSVYRGSIRAGSVRRAARI
jgi:uncharacterized membrane protein YidH (DUF202 family)